VQGIDNAEIIATVHGRNAPKSADRVTRHAGRSTGRRRRMRAPGRLLEEGQYPCRRC
jgi:hypothetical protein